MHAWGAKPENGDQLMPWHVFPDLNPAREQKAEPDADTESAIILAKFKAMALRQKVH